MTSQNVKRNFLRRVKGIMTSLEIAATRLAGTILDRPEKLLQDLDCETPNRTRIPAFVFQTWEGRYFGRRHHRSITSFRQNNPGFTFKLFDSAARDRYMRETWHGHKILDVYGLSQFGVMRADIFRYCILFDKGGFYFDISKGLKVPILDLYRPGSDMFLTQESTWLNDDSIDLTRFGLEQRKFLQWGLGFVAGHPILSEVIRDIESRYQDYLGQVFDDPKSEILNLTGPGAFTRAVYAFLESSPEAAREMLGIDFFGNEIFALKGSGYRWRRFPSYDQASESPLFASP